MITESETIVDSSYMLGILEERLGDFSQIITNYDAVILPVSMKPEGDLLSPNTAHIKGLIKKSGLKPAIAKKEPHEYIAQYSSDAIYPTLLALKDAAIPVVQIIIASYIYDNYIKNHRSNENIKISYTRFNIGNNNFFKKTIEGPAAEVVKLLKGHKGGQKP